MRKATAAKLALPIVMVATLLAVHCNGTNEWGQNGLETDGDGDSDVDSSRDPYEVPPACDPDGHAPCPEDRFICTEDDAGNKHCEGQSSAAPDGGDWDCEVMGTTLVCYGDHTPSDAGDWFCDERGPGDVVCRTHAYVPSGGEGGTWDCTYAGDVLVCDWSDEEDPEGEEPEWPGDEYPPDEVPPDAYDDCPPEVDSPSEEICGDGIDNDCDGWTDEYCSGDEPFDPFEDVPEGDPYNPWDDGPGTSDGPPPAGCLCVPGARRYCDTPTYCRWGIQTCAATGMRWRACRETSVPASCRAVASWYSPEAEQCCISSGQCCQDMWDLDFDGDTWESLGNCTDISCR